MTVNNILQYESNIWATADLLRVCGIKESEWPSYMMPFFALVMIESRLVSWKGYQKDIDNDKTQRFQYLPSISDGQLLFMQHLISKLNANGRCFISRKNKILNHGF